MNIDELLEKIKSTEKDNKIDNIENIDIYLKNSDKLDKLYDDLLTKIEDKLKEDKEQQEKQKPEQQEIEELNKEWKLEYMRNYQKKRYNKAKKIFCSVCNKNINELYFEKHKTGKLHILLSKQKEIMNS